MTTPNSSDDRPPAEKASDEKVKETIEALTKENDSPAVERRAIQDALGYSEEGIRGRLNKLVENEVIGRYDAGGVHIYYLPDDDSPGGEAEPPSVIGDPEAVDPSDISEEKAREIAEERLPEYSPPSFYTDVGLVGDYVLRIGVFLFMTALIGIFIRLENEPIFPDYLTPYLADVTLTGYIITVAGVLIVIFSQLGRRLVDHGQIPPYPSFVRRFRDS